jgi:hypothetical protein
MEHAASAAAQALEAVTGYAEGRQREWMLSDAARALARAGQARQALQVASGIDDPEERAQALSEAAQALARAGQARQALQVASGIDRPEERAQVLSEAARALAKAGQAEQALKAATAIDDHSQRAQALAALLSNPVISSSNSEIGRRTLELLIFTPAVRGHLTAFPIELQRRLVTEGYLEPFDPAVRRSGRSAKPTVDPDSSNLVSCCRTETRNERPT